MTNLSERVRKLLHGLTSNSYDYDSTPHDVYDHEDIQPIIEELLKCVDALEHSASTAAIGSAHEALESLAKLVSEMEKK